MSDRNLVGSKGNPNKPRITIDVNGNVYDDGVLVHDQNKWHANNSKALSSEVGRHTESHKVTTGEVNIGKNKTNGDAIINEMMLQHTKANDLARNSANPKQLKKNRDAMLKKLNSIADSFIKYSEENLQNRKIDWNYIKSLNKNPETSMKKAKQAWKWIEDNIINGEWKSKASKKLAMWIDSFGGAGDEKWLAAGEKLVQLRDKLKEILDKGKEGFRNAKSSSGANANNINNNRRGGLPGMNTNNQGGRINDPKYHSRFLCGESKPSFGYRSKNFYPYNKTNNVNKPYAVRIPIALCIPDEPEVVACLQQACECNLQSLRSARGVGYTKYSAKDIFQYNWNRRNVLALFATVIRTARLYNNYDLMEAAQPGSLIYATNPRYYTPSRIIAEQDDIETLKGRIKRLAKRISTNVIGLDPDDERTFNILTTLYSDSKTNKSVDYLFAINQPESANSVVVSYYNEAGVLTTQTYSTLNSISDILTIIHDIITKCFVDDPVANQITSDLIFCYGEANARTILGKLLNEVDNLDKPVESVHNDYMLTMIHNITVTSDIRVIPTIDTTAPLGYMKNEYISGSRTVVVDSCTDPLNATDISATVDMEITELLNVYKAGDVSIPECIEFTRFTEAYDAALNPSAHGRATLWIAGNTTNDPVTLGYYFSDPSNNKPYITKTLVCTGIQAVMYPLTSAQVGRCDTIIHSGNIFTPIISFDAYYAAAIGISPSAWNAYVLSLLSFWSICDWMPKAVVPHFYVGLHPDSNDATKMIANITKLVSSASCLWDFDKWAPLTFTMLRGYDTSSALSLQIWSANGNDLLSKNIKTFTAKK